MAFTVVGGGITGLIAAIALARRGKQVDLYEKRSHLGGRGASTSEAGYIFNFGPHALYKNGRTSRVLLDWGVLLPGSGPQLANVGYAITGGERFVLPMGEANIRECAYLNQAEKSDFARASQELRELQPSEVRGWTVAEWLDQSVSTAKAREMLQTLIRLSTYADMPEHLSLQALLPQLKVSAGGVIYLDGGWQSLLAGLEGQAADLGVRMHLGQTPDRVTGDTILAIPPQEIEALTGVKLPPRKSLRMSCLDLGLERLPDGACLFALGVDQTIYYSVHSQWARLAVPGKAVVHLGKYLGAGEPATREELEVFADIAMPGWRARVEASRFLPNMLVSHGLPEALTPRASIDVLSQSGFEPGYERVLVAGDWVGPYGMLVDTCTASALAAVQRLLPIRDDRDPGASFGWIS